MPTDESFRLNGEEDVWTVINTATGEETEFDDRPTKDELRELKAEYGYNAVNMEVDREAKTMRMTPVNKSGADDIFFM